MKVKVVNAMVGSGGKRDVWYRHHIGEVFVVNDKPDQYQIYRLDTIVHGIAMTGKGIYKDDCIEVEEIKAILDEVLFEI